VAVEAAADDPTAKVPRNETMRRVKAALVRLGLD